MSVRSSTGTGRHGRQPGTDEGDSAASASTRRADGSGRSGRATEATEPGTSSAPLTSGSDPSLFAVARLPGEPRGRFVDRALLSLHQRVLDKDPKAAELRLQKLAENPFVFFRGTAQLFYADLAPQEPKRPVVLCNGDVHPLNFGVMPGADGEPVFGLNDFDEAGLAPFSFDVKRGATGFVLLATELGWSSDAQGDLAQSFADAYLDELKDCRGSDSEWQERLSAAEADGEVEKLLKRSGRRSRRRFLERRIDPDTGRFRPAPDQRSRRRLIPKVQRAIDAYLDTLADEAKPEAGYLKVKDLVLKQGSGTGSLGQDRYYALIEGPSKRGTDDRILELKETRPSVLAPWAGVDAVSLRAGGERVAEAHDTLLLEGDPLFGHTELEGSAYMVRERSPTRGRIDPGALSRSELEDYARICGKVLARAHARWGKGSERAILKSVRRGAFKSEVRDFALEAATRTIEDCAQHRALLEQGGYDE